MGPVPDGMTADAAQVTAFLRAHPRFLADHPELYRALVPPKRVHGAALADHMAAMLNAERAHAHAMSEQAGLVLAAGRAAAGLAARVQAAVLALMQCQRLDHNLAECIAGEIPALLAVDAANLCAERPVAGARMLPKGTVASLLGSRGVVFRDDPDDAALVHGEAMLLARADVLVRVPASVPMLLALASRDATMLDPQQGSAPLVFLGQAIAAALPVAH